MATRSFAGTRMWLTPMVIVGLLISMAACGSPQIIPSIKPTNSNAQNLGKVAIFTPSDGITFSQHTPLNKWAQLVTAMTESLSRQGFDSSNITAKTETTLDAQSQAIQDYVVTTVASSSNSPSKSASTSTTGVSSSSSKASVQVASQGSREKPTALGKNSLTLIVAPVPENDDASRQYGDYVSHPITWNDDTSSPYYLDADVVAQRTSGERLASALQLAQDSGIHVIVLANPIQGFVPDAFVQIATAENIGEIQAEKLVSKLDLETVSAKNPKSIEVLLPFNGNENNQENRTQTEAATFAQETFSGVWKVLGPYFKSGKLVSPSDTLSANTTDKNWKEVSFSATKVSQVKDMVDKRLNMSSKNEAHTKIDGILAFNDFVASGVTDELTDLGYTGSAADVNPSISILGIVGNIAGKRDLAKKAVPKPTQQPETPSETSTDNWPIVTGYGAYIDIIPQIVNGKQWMTTLENRNEIASRIAQSCFALNTTNSLDKLNFIQKTTIDGKQTPTIQTPLLAVSASNLKADLIDPGYITLADAGL